MKKSEQGRHEAAHARGSRSAPKRISSQPSKRRGAHESRPGLREKSSSAPAYTSASARAEYAASRVEASQAPDQNTVRVPEEKTEQTLGQKRRYAFTKRPLLVACYICLMLSFLVGAAEFFSFKEARVSETENRMLQGFPEFSADSFFSGEFMDGLESYLSDAFYFRDEAADFTDRQLGLFSLPSDEPITWDVDAEHLDAPVEQTPTPGNDAVAEETPVPGSTGNEETTSPEAEVIVPQAAEIDRSLLSEIKLTLWDAQGNSRDLYSISIDQTAAFAEILNNYRAALPADGTLHFVIPPVSAFASNVLPGGNYEKWGSNIEEALSQVVDDGIYIYDVADILTPYLEAENIYPSNDHHWQPISASHVTDEMIRNIGLPPMNYYEYRYYIPQFSLSQTFYGDELTKLPLDRNTIPVLEPVSPVESYRVKNFSERTDDVFIDRAQGSLMSYLGGLHYGPWRLFETGFHTGRKALLVTDSFGLTLTPFLAPYYDELLFVDLRESCFDLSDSGGTIREYIDYYGIDDIYMISSAYDPTIVSTVQARLYKYLG